MFKKIVMLCCAMVIGQTMLCVAAEKESAAMKAHNEKFIQKQNARPKSETSYKSSKKYQNATPAQKSKADAAISQHNEMRKSVGVPPVK